MVMLSIMGAHRIFFPRASKLGDLGLPSPSGVQVLSPDVDVWAKPPEADKCFENK